MGKSDKFDVSKIHRHLHQAIYLPNNAAYVDQMTLPKKVIQFESTDIVAMYCYLFCEVKQQLKETISPEIISLAESFRQHYLGSQDSIFDEQTYEQTLDILKDALETIDHNTPIKDVDYWQYYEAIEVFLYGDFSQSEDGEIWGISNFYSVWESMCLTYLAQNTDPTLLLSMDTEYLDLQLSAKVKLSKKAIDINGTFVVDKDNPQKDLKPDVVVYEKKGAVFYDKNADKLNICMKLKKEDENNKIWIFPDGNYNLSYTAYIVRSGDNSLDNYGHIYDELKNNCNLKAENYTSQYGYDVENLIVDQRIVENYCSYWELEDTINSSHLQWMRYLNHFFYISLEKEIYGWDEFKRKILLPLGVSWNSKHFEENVLTKIVFKKYFDDKDSWDELEDELKEKFLSFINQSVDLHPAVSVIDIKYFSEAYFAKSTNIEEIKRRSVRKQFVYEDLLQKKLEQKYGEQSNFTINSSFWLPSYRPGDPDLPEDGSTFMDDYIQLKKINFQVLADNYVM